MNNPIAYWEITLNVYCPYCSNYIDICTQAFEMDIEACESKQNHEFWCPECEQHFSCDLMY